jgi:hypothetical protein
LQRNDVGIRRLTGAVLAVKRGRHAMGAAPAPDFRWLPLRAGAEGKAPTEINNLEERFPEPAMGTERPVIEVGFPKADVDVAVAVIAGAEVHLCALVTTKPLTGVSGGSQGLLTD